MKRHRILGLLAALTVSLLAVSPVAADCVPEPDRPPTRPDSQQTVVFVGTVTSGVHWYPEPTVQHGPFTIHVERVYVGHVDATEVVLPPPSTTCDQLHSFPVGERILFSTKSWDNPLIWNSVGWVIADDGSVELLPFVENERRYRAITTLDAALREVAPGAGRGHLPDTSIEAGLDATAHPGAPVIPIALVGLGAIGGLWFSRRRQIEG